MKTLMIDMDNVITDGVFLDCINEYLHTNYKFGDFTSYYYVQDLIGDNNDFWTFASKKNFYLDAPLIKDCYEVIQKLNLQYDVYIVTSYLWNETTDISGVNLKNKYEYLKKILPFISPEKYIFTTNKNILNFDIRIDDRLPNLEGAETKLLFTAWHNKNLSNHELVKQNVVRVNGWKDIENLLLENKSV